MDRPRRARRRRRPRRPRPPGAATAVRPPGRGKPRRTQPPTLFDEPAPSAAANGLTAAEPGARRPASPASPVAAAVLKSAAYAAQKKIAGRVSVSDDQVRGLLDALLHAPGHRLAPALAATALSVSPVLLRGAVLHAQRLLNVEGYPVLRVDADGATVILDEALLREQFGIRP